MVEDIWNDYDDDGNGFLDYEETKKFAKNFIGKMENGEAFN